MELVTALRLAGYALGALGGALVFVEFFLTPSYVEYDEGLAAYNVKYSLDELVEHTWIGRIGALLVAVAFALQFFALFLTV